MIAVVGVQPDPAVGGEVVAGDRIPYRRPFPAVRREQDLADERRRRGAPIDSDASDGCFVAHRMDARGRQCRVGDRRRREAGHVVDRRQHPLRAAERDRRQIARAATGGDPEFLDDVHSALCHSTQSAEASTRKSTLIIVNAMGELIGAHEAAGRLGVDVRTLYAYVSRGSLHRSGADASRRSLYDADEVELLVRRGRPRSTGGSRAGIDVVVGSSVSAIGDGWIRYRGIDPVLPGRGRVDVRASRRLAVERFHRSNRTRWRGMVGTTRNRTRAPPYPRRFWLGRERARPHDRGGRRGEWIPGRTGRDRPRRARGPRAWPERSSRCWSNRCPKRHRSRRDRPRLRRIRAIADRLWTRLSPLRATPARVAALDRALVLLAEHELATSTLAVRIATSVRAPLTSVLICGIATLSGSAHAGAATLVHERLRHDETPRRHQRYRRAGYEPYSRIRPSGSRRGRPTRRAFARRGRCHRVRSGTANHRCLARGGRKRRAAEQ